jgi:deoxyribonuclease-4
VHPGSPGEQTLQAGQGLQTDHIELIAAALDAAREQSGNSTTTILLETTAGLKNKLGIGSRFEHLRDIMSRSRYQDLLGICFDTCHVFAAGYDLRHYESYHVTMEQFAEIIGLKWLKFFHLNDARDPCGSGIDRHAHIGQGQIGEAAFRFILRDERFTAIGKCIETPQGHR